MCRELVSLRQSILDYAAGFDAGSLTPVEAGAVVAACTKMESALSSVRAMAAAVLAEGESWKTEGYRSAAEQLADRTGTTAARARKVLDTGRRLRDQPEVAKAALGGELSADKASLVCEGAEANPAKAPVLIERAKETSVGELRDEVARTKAEVVDLEARRREIHRRRSMRFFKDLDGGYHTLTFGHPEDGVALHRVVGTIRRRLNQIARDQGRHEPIDALDYDALIALAKVALGEKADLGFADLVELGLFPDADLADDDDQPPAPAPGSEPADPPEPADTALTVQADLFGPEPSPADGPPKRRRRPGPAARPKRKGRKRLAGGEVKTLVRVDLDTLFRGVPLEGELCEIEGYGPVPVSAIQALAANGNNLLVAAITSHHKLIGVYHHRRRPNAHQQSGLEFIYPSCAVAGCNRRAGLQNDHRIDWAKTHYTAFDLLDRLCYHHHDLKTRHNWALVPGSGKRAFVPPTDPRHPRHQPSQPDDPNAGTTAA